jgi:hypothetical protein
MSRMSRVRRTRSAPMPGELVDGKRKRSKTCRFDFESLNNEEQRMIQQVIIIFACSILASYGNPPIIAEIVQAIRISRLDTKRVEVPIPIAPTYYPNEEEFRDSMKYIEK